MSATLTESTVLKGGEFLIKESNYQDMFIPEDFNEEQLMVKETVRSFCRAGDITGCGKDRNTRGRSYTFNFG